MLVSVVGAVVVGDVQEDKILEFDTKMGTFLL
jgi:hypothetical protein